jgi:hypothetical protein
VTNPLTLTEVPIAPAMSVGEFRRAHFDPRRPVVIRGAIADWPALRAWTDEQIVARVGDRPVPAYEMSGGRIQLDRMTGFRVVHTTLRDYLVRLREAPGEGRLYVRAELPGTLAELLADLLPCPFTTLGRGLRRNLWVAGAATVTHCHFDLPDNLVAIIRGRKRFLLFEPDQGKNLYRSPLLSSTPHLARVDLASPDVVRFPRLRFARGWEATVEQGDLLYIPERFWHWARAVEDTLSVNHWFCRPITAALVAASDAYKRLRALHI